MRRIMGIALGDDQGHRPDGVRVLTSERGKSDPEVARVKPLIKHRQNVHKGCRLPQYDWEGPERGQQAARIDTVVETHAGQ